MNFLVKFMSTYSHGNYIYRRQFINYFVKDNDVML